MLSTVLSLVIALLPTTALAQQTTDPDYVPGVGIDTYNNVTIWQPDDDSHIMTFPRSTYVSTSLIYAAWDDANQTTNTLPIYSSTNQGYSWFINSTVTSKTKGRTLRQPNLLFVGSYNQEDDLMLLAVTATDAKSTNIELYMTENYGKSWDFLTTVATGGASGSATAVGQPFLLIQSTRLTVYYTKAQKIVQASVSDIWDDFTTGVRATTSTAIEQSAGAVALPNKKYIIVYSSAASTTATDQPVQFLITTTPEKTTTVAPRAITVSSGWKPQGAPFVTWVNQGGTNGTIVVSDSASGPVFVNQKLGEGSWTQLNTTFAGAWGREVKAVPNDTTKIRLIGGSSLDDPEADDLLLSILNLSTMLAAAPK